MYGFKYCRKCGDWVRPEKIVWKPSLDGKNKKTHKQRSHSLYYYVSTTSVTLLALYVQNTSPLLLL
jgi:hypothetical protein